MIGNGSGQNIMTNILEYVESKVKDNLDTELLKWMKSHIKYHNYTKLMSHDEVKEKGYGSCHDQVMFELKELSPYHPKAMFLIEYNPATNQGGETHSFVYYKKGDKFYWFENAWGSYVGIHPFNSVSDIKKFIRDSHNNGKLGNVKKFPNIEITSFKSHKPGETLGEFVDKCLG